MQQLPALVVVIPLFVAALLSGLERFLSRRIIETTAMLTAFLVAGLCAWLAIRTASSPQVYWFGGWTPGGGVALGISFTVDLVGASLATLAATLAGMAFVFSWRYFEAIGSLYHALMLVFLAGLIGFSLTGDLFNMFVFFELMSVAAYALTGYKIEEAGPLQGALNFAITNSIGGFLVLDGISLLYARTGALNLAQIGASLEGHPADRLVVTAFILILLGFMIKASLAPFHFAHADAHTVAPTPALVLLSGVMSGLGIYAAARVYWTVFSGVLGVYRPDLQAVLLGAGALTALLGGLMCFTQRNLKRMLAFSTISHVGLFTLGFALLTPAGLAGAVLYILTHGAIKGGLFLCTGILLHRYGSIDELDLRGKARRIKMIGILFVIGGLGLAEMPPFGTFLGKSMIEESASLQGYGWVAAIFFLAPVLTGGAVLRAAGRVFAGWGPPHEEIATEESEQEKPEKETEGGRGRIPRVMTIPVFVLLALGLLIGLTPGLGNRFDLAASQFEDRAAYASRVLYSAPETPKLPGRDSFVNLGGLLTGFGSAAGAVALAALSLFRRRLPFRISKSTGKWLLWPIARLKRLHNGYVCDYVVWLMLGAAVFGGLFVALMR